MGAKKRIFIGIPISRKLQKEILEWEKPWRERLSDEVRWLSGDNLHITLIPPFYADDKEIAAVEEKIKSIADRHLRFQMKFKKVEYGTDKKRPRLIWATGKASEEIVKLKEELERTLGQKSEKRNFLLHLTIARFRLEQFSEFTVKDMNESVEWQDEAESVVIYESKLSRAGAEYVMLSKTKLQN